MNARTPVPLLCAPLDWARASRKMDERLGAHPIGGSGPLSARRRDEDHPFFRGFAALIEGLRDAQKLHLQISSL
jgi:hypothetical protein